MNWARENDFGQQDRRAVPWMTIDRVLALRVVSVLCGLVLVLVALNNRDAAPRMFRELEYAKVMHPNSPLLLAKNPNTAAKNPKTCPEDPENLEYEPLNTPRFAAVDDDRVLNVHIVPHTHDDVGYKKTVDQYYYGLNNTIQNAYVKYILTSSVNALQANPNRTFTYVEQKFFTMWWNEQSDKMKQIVRDLIAKDQLSFVNGGWCMHDEAGTYFIGMIDQTTLGHSFLKRELGVIPKVGWQIDPFGHSATQASYMTAEMGFNAVYFGRIDHQDLKLRWDSRECEGLWSSSPNLEDATIFWGLTGGYSGNYNPPDGFHFDVLTTDEEFLVGQHTEPLIERVIEFVGALKIQSNRTKGNHILLTMGTDFHYSNAIVNFANLDLLIDSMHRFPASGDVDMSSLLGPDFDRLSVFYSSPDYYTEQKYKQIKRNRKKSRSPSHVPTSASGSVESTWATKTDDFFPYSDRVHSYWTGYFTSRAGFKRLERVVSSFLQAARQIESMTLPKHSNLDNCHCGKPLYALEDSIGVAQHHDAVSGTSKQHVANDYYKTIQAGLDKASAFAARKLREVLLGENADDWLQDLSFCQLLNETKCDVSESASEDDKDLYLVVYNGLAQNRSTVVGVPVAYGRRYSVHSLVKQRNGLHAHAVKYWQNDTPSTGAAIVYFETGPLPSIGAAVFRLSFGSASVVTQSDVKEKRRVALGDACQDADGVFSNGILEVKFNCDTGMMEHVTNTMDGSSVPITQEWGYYMSYDSKFDNATENPQQNSGAYIFRPSVPTQELVKLFASSGKAVVRETPLGVESRVLFKEPWIEQVTRAYNDQPYIEVEYTVGPVSINDGIGKEIATRYSTPIQSQSTFYTDSNGREFQKRVRSFRPTWTLDEDEPIAGNYYPINGAIYVEDDSSSLAVVTDRSQGGASLEDGSVELMVQRRILGVDHGGLGEAMNETDGGITPYPPYGNATRVGEGVVIKGKHRLLIGGAMSGASLARSQMDSVFSDPLVFVGSAPRGSEVIFTELSFSSIKGALPSNVMLVTLQLLREEPSTTFLLRLSHQYAAGEDEELSQIAHVDLGTLLSCYKAVSLVEKTLSGNQDRAEWLQNRFNWTEQLERSERDVQRNERDFVVELRPMEIRTFYLKVKKV